MKSILAILIKGYQLMLSPFIGQCCRYYPSCSQYLIQSVYRYGIGRGVLQGLRRILRCNPFFPGGYDPV